MLEKKLIPESFKRKYCWPTKNTTYLKIQPNNKFKKFHRYFQQSMGQM